MIYGGVQKNVGPAGVVIAIIREDLITEEVDSTVPTMLQWKWKTGRRRFTLQYTSMLRNLYLWQRYLNGLKKMGGLDAMKEINVTKKRLKILYDFLDNSKLFKGTVVLRTVRL